MNTTAATLPSDSFTTTGRLVGADRGLGWIIRLDRPLSDLDAMVSEVLPLFAETFGARLHPAGGEGTLSTIDRLITRLRPPSPDGRFPTNVLMALGLIATRTVQSLAGRGTPCTHTDDGSPMPAHSLGDTGGFPDLRIGELAVPVAETVVQRWHDGTSSLEALWRTLEADLARGVEPTAETEAEEVPYVRMPDDLLTLGSLAPMAGFLLVALADGVVEDKEVAAFHMGMWSLNDPVLRQLVVHCPLEGSSIIEHLRERPDLAQRSLAAAGAVFDMHPAGDSARKAFMGLLGGVAASQGELREDELRALALVHHALGRGADFARAGQEPFPEEPDFALASLAPTAAFLLVAAADGAFEEKELRAFQRGVSRVQNNLLGRLLAMGDLADQAQRIVEDPELGRRALEAAGRVFRTHPDGPAAREAFLAMMRGVAEVHGELRDEEWRALNALEHILDGTRPTLWPVIGTVYAVPIALAATVWLVVAGAAGIGAVVPGTLAVVGLGLSGMLFRSRGQSAGAQRLTGLVTTLLTAGAVGIVATLVSLVFPLAAGPGVLASATVAGGAALSAVLGTVLHD